MAFIQQSNQATPAIRIEKRLSTLTGVTIFLIFWLLSKPLEVLLTTAPAFLFDEKLAWYLTRSSGTVAYLLLVTSTIWGLLLSTKVGQVQNKG
ncbi:hypothetical protein KFU94_11795 [Chloroflexi bacterium TSY]|nr:hypothetical protein [Chloroflexi bacterium TSY]